MNYLYFDRQKMVKIANLLAKFIRLKKTYETSTDISGEGTGETGDVSILRSCLYIFNVMDSGIFELHNIQSDTQELIEAIKTYDDKLSYSFGHLKNRLKDTRSHLETILRITGGVTLKKAKTRPKNMRVRYVAAIVANCYRDKFGKWPVTASNNPTNSFRTCTKEICKILDKKHLFGISGACEDFCQNPWELWEHSPPFLMPKE